MKLEIGDKIKLTVQTNSVLESREAAFCGVLQIKFNSGVTAACPLFQCDLGYIRGFYQMETSYENKEFKVDINFDIVMEEDIYESIEDAISDLEERSYGKVEFINN